MSTLKEQLTALGPEGRAQLKQEVIRRQAEGGGGGAGGAIAGGLRGAAQGISSAIQGKPFAALQQTPASIESLKAERTISDYERKERIKATIKKEFADPKEDKFDDVIQKAISGEINFDEVKQKFPLKRKAIEDLEDRLDVEAQLSATVEQDPAFTKGTGTPVSHIKSFFSGSQAEVDEKTQGVIDQIKTQEDIDELILRRDEAEQEGIDVDAILEAFGIKEEEATRIGEFRRQKQGVRF